MTVAIALHFVSQLFIQQPCSGDSWQCPPSDPVCSGNQCTGCNNDSDCNFHPWSSTYPFCNAGACVQCLNSTQCTSQDPVCSNNSCTGCGSDSDCTPFPPGENACQPSGTQNPGACGQCSATDTNDCTGGTPACEYYLGQCQVCTTYSEDGGTLDPGACVGSDAGSACVGKSSEVSCGCNADSDCGGAQSGRICPGQGQTCVSGCHPGTGNGCPVNEVCSSATGTGTCSPPDAGMDGGLSGTSGTDGGTDGGNAQGSGNPVDGGSSLTPIGGGATDSGLGTGLLSPPTGTGSLVSSCGCSAGDGVGLLIVFGLAAMIGPLARPRAKR